MVRGEGLTVSDRFPVRVEITIPCNLCYVSLARQVIGHLAASTARIRQSKVDDLKLAVSEACSNSIGAYEAKRSMHSSLNRPTEGPQDSGGYGGSVGPAVPSVDEVVRITWTEEETFVTVRVKDKGPGFDPQSSFALGDPLETMSGRGIALIRALVDSARFESGPDGTTVEMTLGKARPSHSRGRFGPPQRGAD